MFEIRLVEDKTILRDFMNTDAGETAYALGDLDPAFFPKSVYWGAFDGDKLTGMVLFYTGFQVPVLTLHGTVPAAAEIGNLDAHRRPLGQRRRRGGAGRARKRDGASRDAAPPS